MGVDVKIFVFLLVLTVATSSATADTRITINGRTISTTGSSVTVINNSVIVDGKVLSGDLVEGSGSIASAQRDAKPFDSVRLNMDASVTITRGNEPRCLITADENILPLIATTWSDNVLSITAKQGYVTRNQVQIALETPRLEGAELNGSGRILVTDAFGDKANLVIRGAGDIVAKGQVNEMMARIDGAGNLRARELKADRATASINGAGTIFLHATASLNAEINGSGDVVYTGRPPKVHTSVNGSGTVRQE